MSVFVTYLHLGFLHICSWQATDHLTFLLTLCAPYVVADWRRVVALVTSFTVGHSITLVLATLKVVRVNEALVETLIPITIIVTALVNVIRISSVMARPASREISLWWTTPNALAAIFGLIHGLGFSNYLRALLGELHNAVTELLAFNLGVELGQLLVVGIILLIGFVVVRILGTARRDWILTASGAALGVATLLLLQLHS